MSEVTVRELAEVVGIPVDRLLAQLGKSGLPHTDADQRLNEQDKAQLLGHRREVGLEILLVVGWRVDERSRVWLEKKIAVGRDARQ